MIIRVDDSHLRKKLIVRKRIFNARGLVGYNRERRNFGTRTRGSGDSDEVCLFAHLREGVNSLSDIHEAHCHIEEVDFGMFVHNPHDFARVHCRAAAERDDAIGFEGFHLSGTLFCACKGRVGRDVEERGVRYTHLVEFIGDGFNESVMIKETVGYDEATFFAHNVFKFA